METKPSTNPKIISGTHWSKVIRDELKEEIAQIIAQGRPQPKLAGNKIFNFSKSLTLIYDTHHSNRLQYIRNVIFFGQSDH